MLKTILTLVILAAWPTQALAQMVDPGGPGSLWIKLLFTYGPFAALVFFFYVALAKARRAWQASEGRERKWCHAIYITNWAIIFGLLVFSMVVWWYHNRPDFVTSEHTVMGRFEHLKGDDKVTSRSAPLYLRRVYGPNGDFDYDWRLITDERIRAGDRVKFTFDHSEPERERVADYEFRMKDEFYSDLVRIVFKRGEEKLVLIHGGHQEELAPITEIAGTRPHVPPAHGLFVRTAWAQEPFNSEEYQWRLQSSDPIIRRDARLQLAEEGDRATPWISEVLTDSDSSYRDRLGSLYALNRMGDSVTLEADDGLITAVVDIATHPDPVIRREATRLLVAQDKDLVVDVIDKDLADIARDDGTPRERLSQLARVKMEVLYNAGISLKDEMRKGELERNDTLAAQATSCFDEAWELKALAVDSDRTAFAKVLYGWGHLLHDCSVLMPMQNGTRDPDKIAEAQQMFRRFLALFETSQDRNNYLYPDHLTCAKAYIENPEPESLQ